eukprot:4759322-Ditylum_brightwellii.AAC.1
MAHPLVVGCAMMLGVIIPLIIFPCPPVHQEVSLRTPLVHPVKLHANCAHAALFYCGVDDSTCCGVVSEDKYRGLEMAHLNEGKNEFFILPHVGVQRSNFGLGSRCHYVADSFTDCVDWDIE